jgi:ankyrin repeat protein
MSDRRPLPDHPSLRHLRDEAKARRRAGEFPSLSLAHLAIAREHGFASWPRLKLQVDALTLDGAERGEGLVRSACSSNVRRAQALLEVDPALGRHDLACACVTGEAETVARLVGPAPERASAPTGPLKRPPILYACFSRLGRSDPGRAAGIRSVVQMLIEAGADADARFMNGDWVQSTLYGAAGIAGDAELTALLLEAGADPDDRGSVHSVGEALYHACEQPDPECARLLIEAGTDAGTIRHCLGRALNFPNLAMIRMFCEHGARPTPHHLLQAVWCRRGAPTVELLLDAGAPVGGDPDDRAPSPLEVAERWGDEDVAALLRARGADGGRVTEADRALGAWLAGRDGAAPPHGSREQRRALDQMLEMAIDRGEPVTVRRVLDAGARASGPLVEEGDEPPEFTPLGVAAWRGYADVASELVKHGAPTEFPGGGSAIGAALHGSRHCQDPEGGPTMGTIDEVDLRRYRATVRTLLALGARVPDHLDGDRGPSVTTLMAELGLAGERDAPV